MKIEIIEGIAYKSNDNEPFPDGLYELFFQLDYEEIKDVLEQSKRIFEFNGQAAIAFRINKLIKDLG